MNISSVNSYIIAYYIYNGFMSRFGISLIPARQFSVYNNYGTTTT